MFWETYFSVFFTCNMMLQNVLRAQTQHHPTRSARCERFSTCPRSALVIAMSARWHVASNQSCPDSEVTEVDGGHRGDISHQRKPRWGVHSLLTSCDIHLTFQPLVSSRYLKKMTWRHRHTCTEYLQSSNVKQYLVCTRKKAQEGNEKGKEGRK